MARRHPLKSSGSRVGIGNWLRLSASLSLRHGLCTQSPYWLAHVSLRFVLTCPAAGPYNTAPGIVDIAPPESEVLPFVCLRSRPLVLPKRNQAALGGLSVPPWAE